MEGTYTEGAEERVRELSYDEQQALDRTIREDYMRWYMFLHLSGRRLKETLIRWTDVNWDAGEIATKGEGDTRVMTPITPSIRELLEACGGHHPEFVFTFVAQRTRQGRIAGKRYPITYHGVKTQWRRDIVRAGVRDLRLHDIRHDRATKLYRQFHNLKIVQRVLNHAKYNHHCKVHPRGGRGSGRCARTQRQVPESSPNILRRSGASPGFWLTFQHHDALLDKQWVTAF